MLHIVFGESAGGALRLALRQAGRDDEVLSFDDDLSFGPIDPPNPIVRAAWARTELYFPDATTATLADSLDRFWQRARSVKKPVVWFSRRTASEHCGFLELVSQIGRRSYAVVDAGAVIFYPTRNDGRVAPAMLSLSELSPDLVRANAIWDRAAPLSALERRRYRRLWQRLRRENAPFRVVEGDIVISASAEIYDNMLLSCVTADWCGAARILAAAMTGILNDSGRRAGDLVLFGRLRKLIDAGKLDARGDLATLRGSEVRLSLR